MHRLAGLDKVIETEIVLRKVNSLIARDILRAKRKHSVCSFWISCHGRETVVPE